MYFNLFVLFWGGLQWALGLRCFGKQGSPSCNQSLWQVAKRLLWKQSSNHGLLYECACPQECSNPRQIQEKKQSLWYLNTQHISCCFFSPEKPLVHHFSWVVYESEKSWQFTINRCTLDQLNILIDTDLNLGIFQHWALYIHFNELKLRGHL